MPLEGCRSRGKAHLAGEVVQALLAAAGAEDVGCWLPSTPQQEVVSMGKPEERHEADQEQKHSNHW